MRYIVAVVSGQIASVKFISCLQKRSHLQELNLLT